ncbi:MAG: hypothetical protein FWE07_02595 [Turicibacter sp.]|nr:hypothetical protein [Turicibacter sp.]
MKRKLLITVLAVSTLALTACHRQADRIDHIENPLNPLSTTDRYRDTDVHDRVATNDPHEDYLWEYGFTNIMNSMGNSYYHRYKLDATMANDNDVFHGWRHTWVEPNDFVDKEIDIYRYTADLDGQSRTVHIMSHAGKPIGAYHFGEGESAEQAQIVNRDGHTSRNADEFRTNWNGIFGLR